MHEKRAMKSRTIPGPDFESSDFPTAMYNLALAKFLTGKFFGALDTLTQVIVWIVSWENYINRNIVRVSSCTSLWRRTTW